MAVTLIAVAFLLIAVSVVLLGLYELIALLRCFVSKIGQSRPKNQPPAM